MSETEYATIGDLLVRGRGDYTHLAMVVCSASAPLAAPQAVMAHILMPVGDGHFQGTISDPLTGYRWDPEEERHVWPIPEGWSKVTEPWWERFRSIPLGTAPTEEAAPIRVFGPPQTEYRIERPGETLTSFIEPTSGSISDVVSVREVRTTEWRPHQRRGAWL